MFARHMEAIAKYKSGGPNKEKHHEIVWKAICTLCRVLQMSSIL